MNMLGMYTVIVARYLCTADLCY